MGIELSDKMNMIYACLSDLSEAFITKVKTDKTAVLLIDSWNSMVWPSKEGYSSS